MVYKLYKYATALDPQCSGALQGLAFVHNMNNRNFFAERYLRRAVAIDDAAWHVEFLALVIAERGRHQEAIQLLKQSRHRSHPLLKRALRSILDDQESR